MYIYTYIYIDIFLQQICDYNEHFDTSEKFPESIRKLLLAVIQFRGLIYHEQ